MSGQSSAGSRLSSPVILTAAVALATALAGALFMIAMPLALKVFDPVILAPPFPSQNQHAETFVYMLMIVAITPFSIAAAWVLSRRIDAGPNREALPALTAGLVSLLGLGVLLIRVSSGLPWGDGIKATLVGGVVWTAVALVVLWRAGSSEWKPAAAISRFQTPLFALAAIGIVGGLCSFVRFPHVDVPFLVIGMVAVALVSLAYYRSTARAVPRKWGIASDVLMLVLVIIAVPDMIILYPEAGATDFNLAFQTEIIQFHQSLFLGAASQVLHGSALLVDTVSQYGIGSIYLIAALFKVVPIGDFTLGFFDGVLSGFVFGLGYGILRMARVNRAVSALTMVAAVVALAWGLEYPIGGLLQHGAIRFGLPMLLIAPVVAGARWPRSWRWMKWAALVVLGLSAIWALEAFLYVTFTALMLIAMASAWQPREDRIRWAIKAIAAMVAAWVVTHILFALITLLASGSLPEWGLYLSYLRDFLGGSIGDLTYDVTRWSPSVLVFGIYVVSTAAIVLITLTNRAFTAERKSTFLALTGLTAYGVVLFSYFDNRSLDHVLPYVSLPAVLVLAIWLGLVLDRTTGFSARIRTAAVAASLSIAMVSVASVWPAAGHRSEDSLLAYVIPGGPSLRKGLDRIWHPPPIKPGALSGQILVDQYFAGQDEIPVLTEPDLDVEILDRTKRANSLGITDAKEDSWVPGPHEDRIAAAVDDLKAGDKVLMDNGALTAYAIYRAHPDEVTEPAFAQALADTGLKELQLDAIQSIAERFRLGKVAEGDAGIYVVRLLPKQTSVPSQTPVPN